MAGPTEEATSTEDVKQVGDPTGVDPEPIGVPAKADPKTQAELERDAKRALKAAVTALRQLGNGKYTLLREEVEDIQRRLAGEIEAPSDV